MTYPTTWDEIMTRVKEQERAAEPVDKTAAGGVPVEYENWKIFPCRARSIDESHKAKAPLSMHGVKDATNDPQQIEAWERQFPGCMWGVATGAASGFFVVDLDRGGDHAEGVDGVESLAKYCGDHGHDFPLTLSATTAGGGMHLYFRMPSDGTDIRNSAGKILPGVDVRGTDGYVIVPRVWMCGALTVMSLCRLL